MVGCLGFVGVIEKAVGGIGRAREAGATLRRRFRRQWLRPRRGAAGGADQSAAGRRRGGAARVVATEFGERVGLSDQARKFGERIAGGTAVAAGVARGSGSFER